MIIESTRERTMGEVFDLPRLERGPSPTARAKIVGVATEQEYLDDCLADPSLLPECLHLMVLTNDPNRFWYRVEVD